LVTILVLPLLTCSARLPVYAMLSAMLFRNSPVKAAGVFLGAYLLGIGAALATAWCLKKSLLRGETAPMVLELPPYRWPSLRDALLTTSDRAGVFVRRAGSVILLISVVLWALANYPKLPENRLAEFTATPVSQTRPAGDDAHTADAALSSEQDLAQEQLSFSFAGRIGRVMEPIFRPLGFDSRINVGILSSFAAREVFVSTMAILYGMDEDSSEDSGTLTDTLLRQRHPDGTPVFTTATSASLLVFFVLAMQCAPTQAVTMRETGSWKWAALQLAYMTVLAYLAALVVYQTMSLFPDTQRWALGG
jgi:ferrous iron transport protein B